MSKRGFNESQLRKTVVTMIDKDGFNKRSVFEGPASIGGGLPTPTQDGNALISLNGEWIQQPGYGYSVTEVVETLCEFTSEDFVKVQDADGYYATIPVDQELMQRLIALFSDTEFNVQIDDKVYNSTKDNFTREPNVPDIYLNPDPDNSEDIFALMFVDEEKTTIGFYVPTVPSHAKIYREETTYTGIDTDLTKSTPFYVDLVNTDKGLTGEPSYESKVTFADLDAAIKSNTSIFIRFDIYSSPTMIARVIVPALVYTAPSKNWDIETYMLTSMFPSPFPTDMSGTLKDFEIYLEFHKTNESVLIKMSTRERTTSTTFYTNQV